MATASVLNAPAIDQPLLILVPLYNDWDSLALLLVNLEEVLHECELVAAVLVVDDGSTVRPTEGTAIRPFRSLTRIDILELRRNLGHQRAIAIGLAYVEAEGTCGAVVVMDSDGEDSPSDVPRLIEREQQENGDKIVFAERTRRSESLLFRALYVLYKWTHLLLTGYAVRVGNFSVIPRRRLSSLVVVSELWNHYAAAAFKSRQPHCTIPTSRGQRLRGESKMHFIDLVVHGLSAISVYSEIVGVRLLVLAMILILADLGGIAAIVLVRSATEIAIPGWTTTVVGILLILLGQALVLTFIFSFVVLSNRNNLTFLPCRDYTYFIKGVTSLHPKT